MKAINLHELNGYYGFLYRLVVAYTHIVVKTYTNSS